MPQGVFLSEQKGLPCVLRLCFKRERAKSKTSCFMGRSSVSASHITPGLQEEKEGVTRFHAVLKIAGLGAQALLWLHTWKGIMKAPSKALFPFSCWWYLNFSWHLCGEHARLN